MSTHQYIGARYVPYFYQNSLDPTSTEWEANVTYEPLTVVTLPNLHTYISKKTVPNTVGTPASNPEYWLETGEYDAYIQDLQNQIDTHTLQLTSIQSDINTDSVPYHKILVIGDSYGEGFSPDGNTTPFIDILASELGSECKYINSNCLGGSGLLGDQYNRTSFYELLTNLDQSVPATEKPEITDIIFEGFCNDQAYTDLGAVNGHLGAIKTFCDTHYPKAKLWLCPVGWTTDISISNKIFEFMTALRSCYVFGFNYMPYVDQIMHQKDAFASDGLHPNQGGQTLIGMGIASVLRGGKLQFFIKERVDMTPTPNFAPTTNEYFVIERVGDKIKIKKDTNVYWQPSSGGIATQYMNESWKISVGRINSNNVIGNGFDTCTVNALVFMGTKYYQAPLQVSVESGFIYLSGYVLDDTGTNFLNGTIDNIQVEPFVIELSIYN